MRPASGGAAPHPVDLLDVIRRLYVAQHIRDHGAPPSEDRVRQALTPHAHQPDAPEPEQRMGREAATAACEGVGTPRPMLRLALNQEDAPQARWAPSQTVARWMANPEAPRTLALAGAPLAGKSTAAALAILLRVRQLGSAPAARCWWPFGEFATHCASGYDDSRIQIQKAYTCALLVIDNLLARQDLDLRTGAAVGAKLIDILEQRQNHGRLTLLTTNESLDMLRQEWGEAIASHLQTPRGFFYRSGECAEKRFPMGDIRTRAARWGDIVPASAWTYRETNFARIGALGKE